MARKRNTIGCLFYVALVLLVLVIFLFNRSTVQEVIRKTGFSKLFEKKSKPPVEVVITPPETESQDSEQKGRPAEGTDTAPKEIVVTVDRPRAEPKKPEGEPAPKTRRARLFFIAVSSEGRINIKGVIRPVQYMDAPLAATMEALLAGPTSAEVNQGLISLISPATRLRRVYIKEDTAYLDFSEAFRFNSLGKEGMQAQLKQVVYSATEFSNVKKVQVLIEGKTADYMGPEGVYIGKPLSRDQFQN